jgi:hypothetical protein
MGTSSPDELRSPSSTAAAGQARAFKSSGALRGKGDSMELDATAAHQSPSRQPHGSIGAVHGSGGGSPMQVERSPMSTSKNPHLHLPPVQTSGGPFNYHAHGANSGGGAAMGSGGTSPPGHIAALLSPTAVAGAGGGGTGACVNTSCVAVTCHLCCFSQHLGAPLRRLDATGRRKSTPAALDMALRTAEGRQAIEDLINSAGKKQMVFGQYFGGSSGQQGVPTAPRAPNSGAASPSSPHDPRSGGSTRFGKAAAMAAASSPLGSPSSLSQQQQQQHHHHPAAPLSQPPHNTSTINTGNHAALATSSSLYSSGGMVAAALSGSASAAHATAGSAATLSTASPRPVPASPTKVVAAPSPPQAHGSGAMDFTPAPPPQLTLPASRPIATPQKRPAEVPGPQLAAAHSKPPPGPQAQHSGGMHPPPPSAAAPLVPSSTSSHTPVAPGTTLLLHAGGGHTAAPPPAAAPSTTTTTSSQQQIPHQAHTAADEALPPGAKATRILSLAGQLPAGMSRKHWSLSDYAIVRKMYTGYASTVYHVRARVPACEGGRAAPPAVPLVALFVILTHPLAPMASPLHTLQATCKKSLEAVALKVYHMEALCELNHYQVRVCVRCHLSRCGRGWGGEHDSILWGEITNDPHPRTSTHVYMCPGAARDPGALLAVPPEHHCALLRIPGACVCLSVCAGLVLQAGGSAACLQAM